MVVLDTGDTAFILASAALVLLMTPGLAFFYGGQTRSKSVLNMMMMSFSAIGLIGVLWVLYGYSLAFGDDVGNLFGDPSQYFGLNGLIGGYADGGEVPLSGSIPATVFVGFQAMFAIITVALISGAAADRMRFGSWMLFAGLWGSLVYFPVAHWVFDFDDPDSGHVGGWIANKLAAVDFAGGTAVHINAGAAALVLALILGRRRGWPNEPMRPHNLPFVMLGAGLLWFGWYGFNAGSALAADGVAGSVFITTTAATCAAMLAWLMTERLRDGHATSLGAASGVVAGLVAITPSCSSVNIVGALVIGAVAGIVCALAVGLKYRFGYDDSLDVVGVHLVGGLIGTLMVGVIATPTAPAGVESLFYGGSLDQLGRQAVGAFAVLLYSMVGTAVIALVVKALMGLRIEDDLEQGGIDESEHAEGSYDFASLGGGASSRLSTSPVPAAPVGREG